MKYEETEKKDEMENDPLLEKRYQKLYYIENI